MATNNKRSAGIDIEPYIDKVRTPSTRAGNTVERVGKLNDAGVGSRAIAALMEENTKPDIQFSEVDIKAIIKVWQCSQSNVLITKSQCKAIIQDQLESRSNLDEIDSFAY